jgi:hypothetical protein
MWRRLTVFFLVAPLTLAVSSQVGATSLRPTGAIFPFRASSYTTSMAAAKAFGVLVGFARKDRYLQSGDVVGVVVNAPTFESYIHLKKSGGTWYVVSVTTPVIDTTSPTANSVVSSHLIVRAFALAKTQYIAILQVNDSKLTPGTALNKSDHHYTGPTTSIGANADVGVYSGKINFTPRKNQWGYVLVLATSSHGDALAAQSIRIDN